MIDVSKDAIKQIKDELDNIKQEDPSVKDPYIRLYMTYGWGGPRLQLALAESPNDDDNVTEIDGVKFLVHANQEQYFKNVTLDFVKNMFGMGEFTLVHGA